MTEQSLSLVLCLLRFKKWPYFQFDFPQNLSENDKKIFLKITFINKIQ
jgi:hypothetical protein